MSVCVYVIMCMCVYVCEVIEKKSVAIIASAANKLLNGAQGERR